MKQITLNLSNSPITSREDGYREVSIKEFWKEFFRLTGQDLSDKESDVMSDYMIDSVPSKIPNTVINSLNKKGLLNGRELSEIMEAWKGSIVHDSVKLIFNYGIRRDS